MRSVVFRVSSASVSVDGRLLGAIGPGLLVLLAIERGDAPATAATLARKLAAARLFSDASGRPALDLRQRGGQALVISQFTLLGSLEKGTRPDFHRAAPPEQARALYEHFLACLETELAAPVSRGEFGADMRVESVNDGPFTLVLDLPPRTRPPQENHIAS
jgi:D-tyrosyl-tRNA(Tyr) deacylase